MITSSEPQLVLDQVSLKGSIGSAYVLSHISFSLNAGDRLALVGPSGAGKTSLLRLINRLQDPSEGAIYFEGQNIQQISVLQLRRQVTLLLQESKLLEQPVGEALRYPLMLRGLKDSTIQARLEYWMTRLKIPQDWLDRTELQLSVGQRQLVAIARVLMIEPQVLLLDEPTSALDAGRSERLVQVLTEWSDEKKITIIMANHQLPLAQALSHRVLALEHGRLWLNQPTVETDWTDLKNRIVQAELESAQEWDETADSSLDSDLV